MKKYCLVLLFAQCTFLGFTQNTKVVKIDSLLKRLNSANSDIEQEKVLVTLSEVYSYANPDSSIYFANKALDIAIKNPQINNKDYIYYLLGDACLVGEIELSRDYFMKSITEAKQSNNIRIEYLSTAGLGAYYSNISLIDSALHHNSIALNYFEKIQDTLALITCYQNMMSIYTDINDNKLTIKYGLKCVELAKSKHRAEVMGQIYIGLSYAYTNLGGDDNLIEAEKYLAEAENLAKGNNDNELLLYIYQVRGIKEFRNKNYLAAIPLMEKAVKYSILAHDEFNESMSHYNLGTAYYRSNQKKKAEEHFELVKDNIDRTRNYLYLALINSNVNDNKCLMYLAKYDSLNKLEKRNRNKELLVKYESLEKEKENLALTVENKNKELENQKIKIQAQKHKFWLVIGVGLSAIILGLGYWFYRRKRRESKNQINNLQKQALQLQLNPHFFFNALNSINSYVGNKESEKAKYYLGKFSKLMRLTLENSQIDYVTLEDELAFIENYMALEQMNNHVFDYTITVDDDLLAIEIPSMLLQPFIENSIEHAFVGLESKGEIHINISENNNNLIVNITDNGVGLSEAKIKSDHKSLAISILEKRIRIYSKGKSKVEFKIPYPNQKNKGAQVIFSIPIKNN